MQTESLHLLLQLGVGSDGVAYHLGCSVGLGEDVGEHVIGRDILQAKKTFLDEAPCEVGSDDHMLGLAPSAPVLDHMHGTLIILEESNWSSDWDHEFLEET